MQPGLCSNQSTVQFTFSPIYNRNFAAAFLIMNIPLTVVLVLKARDTKDAYIGIISTALMLTFLIYTRTRGAWIGFFCGPVSKHARAIDEKKAE